MNMMDILSIQECLVSYKKLLEWFPVTNEFEEAMRDERFGLIDYLVDKMEAKLEAMKDGSNK